jgi:hypothetical protein
MSLKMLLLKIANVLAQSLIKKIEPGKERKAISLTLMQTEALWHGCSEYRFVSGSRELMLACEIMGQIERWFYHNREVRS